MVLQDFTKSGASLPVDAGLHHYVIKNTIDCYHSVADGGFGTWTSGDTARLLEIKEGWLVERIYIRVVKASTLAAALDKVGDSVTADNAWMAADVALNTINLALGGLHTDTNGALNGYLYLTDDYLLGTVKTQNFDGIFEIAAVVVDLFGGKTIV